MKKIVDEDGDEAEIAVVAKIGQNEYREHQVRVHDKIAQQQHEAKMREQENFRRNGFIAHVVKEDEESPTGFNVHTHGFMESWNHPDIQIVLPMTEDMLKLTIKEIAERVKHGAKFRPGDRAENIIKGATVKFIHAVEDNRSVLRVILPDRQGKLDKEAMEDRFQIQYEKTNWVGDMV